MTITVPLIASRPVSALLVVETGMLSSVGLLLPLAPSEAQALDALWSLTEQLPQSITVAVCGNTSN